MNPWELVGWVGAIAACVLIVAITAAVVIGVVRGALGKRGARS